MIGGKGGWGRMCLASVLTYPVTGRIRGVEAVARSLWYTNDTLSLDNTQQVLAAADRIQDETRKRKTLKIAEIGTFFWM